MLNVVEVKNDFYKIEAMLDGIFNANPPLPRQKLPIWDINLVLDYMESLPEKIPLKVLAPKLATLLMIVTLKRKTEIWQLSLDHYTRDHTKNTGTFIIQAPVKQFTRKTFKNHKASLECQKVVVEGIPKNLDISPKLDPLRCLDDYISRTEKMRQDQRLFISRNMTGASKQTLHNWVRGFLHTSGVDIRVYSPHSIRSATSSALHSSGAPVNEVLSKAGWLNESTFTRHYLRDIDRRPSDDNKGSTLWKHRARPIKPIASSSEITGLIESGKIELLTSKYGYKQRSKIDQYVIKPSSLAVEKYIGITFHEMDSNTIVSIEPIIEEQADLIMMPKLNIAKVTRFTSGSTTDLTRVIVPEIFQAPREVDFTADLEESISEDDTDSESLSIVDITNEKVPRTLKRLNSEQLAKTEVGKLIASTLSGVRNRDSPVKLSSIINAVHNQRELNLNLGKKHIAKCLQQNPIPKPKKLSDLDKLVKRARFPRCFQDPNIMAKTLNLKSEINIKNSNKINVTIANGKFQESHPPQNQPTARKQILRMLLMSPDGLIDRDGNPIRSIQILQAQKDPRGGKGCYFMPMGNSTNSNINPTSNSQRSPILHHQRMSVVSKCMSFRYKFH